MILCLAIKSIALTHKKLLCYTFSVCILELKHSEFHKAKISVLLMEMCRNKLICTHNSRYFTCSLSVVLLRVTVNAKFLNFKLNVLTKGENSVKNTIYTAGNSTSSIQNKLILPWEWLCNFRFSFVRALPPTNRNYHNFQMKGKCPNWALSSCMLPDLPQCLKSRNITMFFHDLEICWWWLRNESRPHYKVFYLPVSPSVC